ncbi:hypothetical protein [Clostridioides difficile]|nr:hypothetical protein [Clostridioides difficile]MCR1380461.1 hypothetical protein [Clostridioides difficile]MDB9655811.1 hypothetical protein [Clostridioides difficile]MDE3402377.1 hypothetical protein [Clostridioides difficile]MDK3379988.1 hypothetical protein [Clostridioides difficile]MDV9365880.1 hypothetical protein [Clostridioides difficile]
MEEEVCYKLLIFYEGLKNLKKKDDIKYNKCKEELELLLNIKKED